MTGKKVSPALASRLNRYYGGKTCVVLGTAKPLNGIEWAHLDENNRNTVFENLVPLSAGFNYLQEEWRRKQSAGDRRIQLRSELCSNFVRHQAHQHFQEGRPALAVGACWLAVHLAERYPREFRTAPADHWAHLSQTLFYLPYRMDGDLLRALLRRLCHYAVDSTRPPQSLKFSILLSIANLYQDLGMWPRADEIYRFLHRRIPPAHSIRAAMLRRRSVSTLVRRGVTKRALYRLDQAVDLNPSFDFMTASDITRAWAYMIRGNPRQALQTLDSAWEACHAESTDLLKYLSPHNIFELTLTRAAAHEQLGRSSPQEHRIFKDARLDMPHTQLRSVFSQHVFPALSSPVLSAEGREIGTNLTRTKDLLLLLETGTNSLLSLRTSRSGRDTGWAD